MRTRRQILITVCFAASLAAPLNAQLRWTTPRYPPSAVEDSILRGSVADRAQIATAVAWFRKATLGDTAQIDFCNALKIVGDSLALRRVSKSQFSGHDMFVHRRPNCEESGEIVLDKWDGTPHRYVSIDAIAVRGNSAEASVAVGLQRQQSHHETITLTRGSATEPWFAVSARVWGVMIY